MSPAKVIATFELTMTRPDGGNVTIKTAVARAWTQAELGEQIDRLTKQLSADDPAEAG